MTEQNNELKQVVKTERKEKHQRGLKPLPDGRWQYSWMFQGKYHRKIARTKSEAKSYLEKIHTEIREGRYLEVKLKRVEIVFEDAVIRFLQWSGASNSKSTHDMDALCAKSWLDGPYFKRKTLDGITGNDVERYKQSLFDETIKNRTRRKGKPLSSRTIDIRISRLKRLFSLCVDWELCERNPASKIKLLKRDNKIERFLSDEEEDRLLEATTNPLLKKAIRFAIHTGMRRGEMLGLKWSDINPQTKTILIPGTRAKGKRERVIPLNPVAWEILQSLPRPMNRESLVFSNSKGRFWDRLRTEWEKVRKAAGLDDVRWHDLRHTYASRLVMSGNDLAVIRELLGHQDFKTTLRYAHLSPERLHQAVATLVRPVQNLQFSCNPESAKKEPIDNTGATE